MAARDSWGMRCLGVDLGYGATKWVCGTNHGIFTSAWTAYDAESASWGLGTAAKPLMVDGRPVTVGDRAARLPNARRLFGDGRLGDPDALPILGEALWQSGVEGEVVLASGPPLGQFAAERDEAREALEGRILRLGNGRSERSVRIARLVLRPQGVGAAMYLADHGLLPSGAGYVAIVDVGTRTTEVMVAVLKDLSPVMDLSCSLGLGLATAANSLAVSVQQRTGHLPPFDVAMEALREPQPWHGAQIGGPEAAARHLDTLATSVKEEVRRVLGDSAQQVAVVGLVGGGAASLRDRLDGFLPGRCLALTDEERLYANAFGFAQAAALSGGAGR